MNPSIIGFNDVALVENHLLLTSLDSLDMYSGSINYTKEGNLNG